MEWPDPSENVGHKLGTKHEGLLTEGERICTSFRHGIIMNQRLPLA